MEQKYFSTPTVPLKPKPASEYEALKAICRAPAILRKPMLMIGSVFMLRFMKVGTLFYVVMFCRQDGVLKEVVIHAGKNSSGSVKVFHFDGFFH
jgi:hypothetical protein